MSFEFFMLAYATLFPRFSLSLRERTLVTAGQAGGLVAVVSKTQNTGEFANFEVCWSCWSKEQIYSQGFPFHTRAFDLKLVVVVVDSQKVSFAFCFALTMLSKIRIKFSCLKCHLKRKK